MIGIPIKYKNADDQDRTGTYWFHISKPEMIRLNGELPGGLSKLLTDLEGHQDGQGMFEFFEKLVFLAHGVRTDDGEGFEKSDEIVKKFKQSFAYEALFDQVTESEDKFAAFVVSILPKGFESTLAEEEAKLKVVDNDKNEEGPKPPTS